MYLKSIGQVNCFSWLDTHKPLSTAIDVLGSYSTVGGNGFLCRCASRKLIDSGKLNAKAGFRQGQLIYGQALRAQGSFAVLVKTTSSTGNPILSRPRSGYANVSFLSTPFCTLSSCCFTSQTIVTCNQLPSNHLQK